MSPGLLISFEGIDGCGKTTQARLLADRLDGLQARPLLVREPGGTAAGEHLRALLLNQAVNLSLEAEILLFAAARTELVREAVAPALAAGRPVICDRFTDSTLAYQGYGSGGDREWIKVLNQRAACGLRPRCTFLLDLPAEEAAARRRGTGDRVENHEPAFHQRVRQGYLDLAGKDRDRFILLDASLDPAVLHAAVWSRVLPLLTGLAGT